MSLVGKKAPQFTSTAWLDGQFRQISLKTFLGKYVVLFFYPFDFSFVCPTEIIAFNNLLKSFKKLDCQVIGCSVDSKFCHMEYQKKQRKDGGVGLIDYPIISDLNQSIAKSYGCFFEEQGKAFRATYIIDEKGIVRHASISDTSVGRNPNEFLRLVKAFQFTSEKGEVCPANWDEGKKSMIPDVTKNNYKEVIFQAN